MIALLGCKGLLGTVQQVHLALKIKSNEKIYLKKYPANIYLFKVNNENTRKRCEIGAKLTIKTPEGRQ